MGSDHVQPHAEAPPSGAGAHDLSSMRFGVHGAAPCPVAVKQAMLEWWGPILYEFYAGTEGNGMTLISAEEWLERPGSVGRSVLGVAHIVDDDGCELGPGETGTVWFSDGFTFEYHDDPEKTARAYDGRGWSTLGDVGHLDDDGYLYLTDRQAFMIIAGGVNIYPRRSRTCSCASRRSPTWRSSACPTRPRRGGQGAGRAGRRCGAVAGARAELLASVPRSARTREGAALDRLRGRAPAAAHWQGAEAQATRAVLGGRESRFV